MKKNIVIFTVFTAIFFMVGCHKLQWSNRSPDEMNWPKAIEYCRNLNEGGHRDWRLPDIDELRTLIQNHSGTQSGGSCPISERAGKLAWDDRTSDCDGRSGRNFSKLGDTGWFWSSSTHSDDSHLAWLVGFSSGLLGGSSKIKVNNVRCVR